MKSRLLALVPWMVLAVAGYGQVRSADVVYTSHGDIPQPGYRVADECFVAVETVELWGWKVTIKDDAADIEAEGHKIHLDTRFVSNRTTIPFRKAVKELGGESEWTTGTDSLAVYSTLNELSVHGGKIHAASALAFKATPFYLKPDKTVVDLCGVRLGDKTKQDLQDGARVTQYRPNVVRLTLNTTAVPKLPSAPLPEGATLDLDLAPPAIAAPQAQTATPFPDTVPPIDGPAPILLSVTVDTDTDTSTVLNFHLGTRYAGQPQIQKPDPDTLQIILPGLAGVVPGQYTVDTKAIESLSSAVNGGKTTLTVKLARPMGAQVIAGPEGVSLLLYKPNVGNGKIAGKLIVVDPGHGGHDSGATSGELREKDLNLSIGLQLARKLAQAGATVILTRQTDVFIPLMTRSVISNDAHADFFISCHINSTGNSERLSGTTTYHHIGNKVAYLLAESIQHEIAKVNGLPNKGAVSDGTIYSSGFSVLRHTTAPAVLVEMGFINHPKDRARMQSKDFQDSVTNAIVKGVRVFLGDVKPNE